MQLVAISYMGGVNLVSKQSDSITYNSIWQLAREGLIICRYMLKLKRSAQQLWPQHKCISKTLIRFIGKQHIDFICLYLTYLLEKSFKADQSLLI